MLCLLKTPELFRRTFWSFAREFLVILAARGAVDSDADPGHGFARLLGRPNLFELRGATVSHSRSVSWPFSTVCCVGVPIGSSARTTPPARTCRSACSKTAG